MHQTLDELRARREMLDVPHDSQRDLLRLMNHKIFAELNAGRVMVDPYQRFAQTAAGKRYQIKSPVGGITTDSVDAQLSRKFQPVVDKEILPGATGTA